MNSVQLIGRLTKDPEIRYTSGENAMAVARFNIAIDRRFKNENSNENADFISCVAFNKTAELIDKHFEKGQKIGLVGRIQSGSYTNKDGQKVYTTDIIVEQVEFIERRKQQENNDLVDIPDNYVEDEGLPFR